VILAYTTGSPRFAISRTGLEVAEGGSGITWSCTCPNGDGYHDKPKPHLCRHLRRFFKEACDDHFLTPYFALTPSGKDAAPDCPCGPCYYSTPAAPPPPPDPEGNAKARQRAAKSRAHKTRLRALAAPRAAGRFAPASPKAQERAQARRIAAAAEKLAREKRMLAALKKIHAKEAKKKAKK
jgi:hypothetical protein